MNLLKDFLARWKKLWIVSTAFFLLSCTPPEARDFNRATDEAKKSHHRIALSYFDRVLKRDQEGDWGLRAAREGARISVFELKDYKKAGEYLRHLVLHSSDPIELEQAQRQLADVYFENLNDYAKAYAEFSKLLTMKLSSIERAKIQIKMARASFYLGDFRQAESEVETVLANPLESVTRFQALTLKGNILVAQKQYAKAAEIYQLALKDFPDLAREEHVHLQLAVCFEEDQRYRDAIATLEAIRTTYQPPEYIELRIKRLQEKIRNQPGAKGFRK